MTFRQHRSASMTNILVAAILAATYHHLVAAEARTAQYWLDNPVERASRLKECMALAPAAEYPADCVNAGRAAAAAFGRYFLDAFSCESFPQTVCKNQGW